jgi:hypothetical protein
MLRIKLGKYVSGAAMSGEAGRPFGAGTVNTGYWRNGEAAASSAKSPSPLPSLQILVLSPSVSWAACSCCFSASAACAGARRLVLKGVLPRGRPPLALVLF